MTVTITQEKGVVRPTPKPLRSSILDHATVVNTASFGLRNNEGLWPSYNCMDTTVPTFICPSPDDGENDPDPYKTFDVAPWVPAFEFAMQGGAYCSAVGTDVTDQKTDLERVFRANEGRGVEGALADIRFVASTAPAPVTWPAPVDLTPSPSIDLKFAVAALEGYAAATYAGVPTIHMPRFVAVALGEQIEWRDGLAYTLSGAKVACGGGYDTYSPQTNKVMLYVTGEVFVERSEEVSIQTYVVPGDGSGTGSDENGLPDNSVLALVERMYRVGVDCMVAKIEGTVW